jgi:hypothetical protein
MDHACIEKLFFFAHGTQRLTSSTRTRLTSSCRGTRRPHHAPETRPAADDYDRVGCLRGVNDVARHHNALLLAALGGLRAKHPRATIIFADFFYDPILQILENPNCFSKKKLLIKMHLCFFFI